MAEDYADALLNKDDAEIDKLLDENLADLQLNEKQAGTLLGIIKGVGICSFLEGLKAGRKENEDLKKQIEQMKSCSNCKKKFNRDFELCFFSGGDDDYDCRNRRWELAE